jgi:hypothetical protein
MSLRWPGKRRGAVLGACAGLSLLLAGAVGAQAAASSGTIQACVNPESGALVIAPSRLIPNPAQCPHEFVPLSWNQQGPPGPAGPQGPQGPQGPAGGLKLAASAVFRPDGTLNAGSGVGQASGCCGQYIVQLTTTPPPAACTVIATPATLAGSIAVGTATPGLAFASPYDARTGVFMVETTDLSGKPTPHAFQAAVFC